MEEVKVGGVFGPTIPVRLTWNELNVFREIKRGPPCKKATETKHILKNVSGYVNGGEMLAIMGGSGSGKTTLLNVLTHRNVRGMDISGSVQVNGDELGQHMTSVSAYVQQEGLFVPTLTVREHLIFQSTLRLPSKLAHKEKIQKADDIIYELGLRKCAYARIGSGTTARGISGGEARRLAFASELLTDPPLFFCDEPTTGLDTCMAENIVQCLQQLANHGKVVICIIHQPASEIFELFNKILLLAEGKTAYIGTRTEALSFFEKAGYLCPLNYNPADFYIETLAVVPTEEEACRKQIKEICDKYNDSEYSSDVEKLLTWDSSKDGEHLKMNGKKGNGSVYKTGWFMQFFVLLWRALRDNFRNPRTTLFKLIQKLVFGVFVGLCFSGTELDQIGVINISGVMFVLLVDNLHMIVIDIVNVLNAEYAIIVREHHTGMYSVGSYYLSRILSFIPTHIIATIFGTIPPYFMAGLRTKLDAFLIALGIVTLAGQVSFAYGTMLSCFTSSLPVLLLLIPSTLCVVLLTGGFFLNLSTMPFYISWIQYVSWVRYAYEALAVNQWQPIEKIDCQGLNRSCIRTGDNVLDLFGFYPSNFFIDIGLLCALGLAFYLIGYVILRIRIDRAR